MKKALIVPAVIIVLLIGCRPEENPDQLIAVNQSLEYANGVMQEAGDMVYEELLERQKDPRDADHPALWLARAKQIKQYADSLGNFIKNIKSELITQSDSLKKDYVELTKQLHNEDGVGQQLLNKLTDFKDSASSILTPEEKKLEYYRRSEIGHILETGPLLPAYRDSLPADKKVDYKKKWLEKSFGRTSALMAMIMLNKIEADVLATEKEFITYCDFRASFHGCIVRYDLFKAVAILSSSYVKAGQAIEVTAAVGQFIDAMKPRITIDGKEVQVGECATAVYKFIAAGKPGKYTVPITFQYYKPDGTKDSIATTREYIIAEN
ncbi:hypothetical protein A4D02_00220 [Niastella koreensis]|uniref:Uncharacterized protein n=2 Tax=Niastella koreensis TaxID=354356 RepID=G8TA40_NIAKG|nr:hypothetical protein [Niastella koreensis]AEW02412.1 hypothetical protein Niako_6187 [Niastella koreensis GR20-10]OQP54789.1 hypothetical protein A4D02_00220 [Niastella koreensis]